MRTEIYPFKIADATSAFVWLIMTNIGLVLVARDNLYMFGALELIFGFILVRPPVRRVFGIFLLILVPVILLAAFHIADELPIWKAVVMGHNGWSTLFSTNAMYYSGRIFFGSTAAAIYVTNYSASEVAAVLARFRVPASSCVALQISFSALPIFLNRFRERIKLFWQRDQILRSGDYPSRLFRGLYMLAFDAMSAADSIALSAGSRGFQISGARTFAVDIQVRLPGLLLVVFTFFVLMLSLVDY